MYLEKIKVEKNDTILVYFNLNEDDLYSCLQHFASLKEIYPNNPIIPIIPKYGIEKFETRSGFTGSPYSIKTSGEC